MILDLELAVKTEERGLWAIIYSSLISLYQCAIVKKANKMLVILRKII